MCVRVCVCTQSFEQLNERSVAVVVDPIQSVKGKVVIDAFRTINPHLLMTGKEPRQTTSNIGHLNKPSIQVRPGSRVLGFFRLSFVCFSTWVHSLCCGCVLFLSQALIHGLNRHYYSMNISYRKNELEEKMLMNLHRKKWSRGLTLTDFNDVAKKNTEKMEGMAKLAEGYKRRVDDEETKTAEELLVAAVGKIEPKKRLEADVSELLASNIVQCLGMMLDTVVF